MWFEAVVNLIDKSSISCSRKLGSAVCIAYCIGVLPAAVNVLSTSRDPEKFMLQLAGLLKFNPDASSKTQYEYLCSQIPLEFRYGTLIYVIVTLYYTYAIY